MMWTNVEQTWRSDCSASSKHNSTEKSSVEKPRMWAAKLTSKILEMKSREKLRILPNHWMSNFFEAAFQLELQRLLAKKRKKGVIKKSLAA